MSTGKMRRLVSKITPVESATGARSASTPGHPVTGSAHTGPHVDNDRPPLATEMAEPSFMILSTRPRPRRHER
ncbi:hypothetical protein [Streptomyces subrutilus]|uniref:Uncharacterized protein n=1 Tax=Streptomyces subrutilus TaxID=36818 RepID=A0A1E5PXD7_9ACTN|nr:hypothetical protein [Streptomyces subrutilus]OEJ34022.1 hypothetical protein BGK67_24175 [Streptomyces subrutilus]